MGRLIDLSHAIVAGMKTYPGLPGPEITDHLTRDESERNLAPGTTFHIGRIDMVANTGTYLDAPFHRFAGGADLADLPLEVLADLSGVRVNAAGRRPIGADAFDAADLGGKAVVVETGWSEHWGTPAYGVDGPFLTEAAVDHLVAAQVALVGIDSVNIDDMRDPHRPAHSKLLAAGIPIVEHLTRLALLPDTGFRFFAVPPKVVEFGTFPVRAFALISP